MTKDEIIRMAREADLWGEIYAMQRFANLVAAVEREACAAVCLDLAKWHSETVMAAFESAADAIKARGSNDV